MSTVIEHVRHRVDGRTLVLSGGLPGRSDGIRLTACGRTFVPAIHRRDWSVHEPARTRCPECYRGPA